jgi:hypothetical protein
MFNLPVWQDVAGLVWPPYFSPSNVACWNMWAVLLGPIALGTAGIFYTSVYYTLFCSLFMPVNKAQVLPGDSRCHDAVSFFSSTYLRCAIKEK